MINNFRIVEKCCLTCGNRKDVVAERTKDNNDGYTLYDLKCGLTNEYVVCEGVCDKWIKEIPVDIEKSLIKSKVIEFLHSEEGKEAIRKAIAEGTPFSDKVKKASNPNILNEPKKTLSAKDKCRHIVAIGYVSGLLLELHEDDANEIIEEYKDAEICWLRFCAHCGKKIIDDTEEG